MSTAHPTLRPAFTLVEAMVALSATALAGGLILLAVESSLDATGDSVDQAVAQGLAEQLMDEVASRRYYGLGDSATKTTLGPSSYEAQSVGRERYDDVGDFNGYVAQPPKARFGQSIGQEDGSGTRHANFQAPAGGLANLRQRVDVYYVSDTDLSVRLAAGLTSNHRAVEVTIERVASSGAAIPLAHVRRVFAYVPTL